MKIFPTIFSLLFLVLPLSACKDASFKKDMIAFERVFIPAWYYAYTGDLDNAEKAIKPLLENWDFFRRKHIIDYLTDEQWSEAVYMTGAWLEDAECALLDGEIQRAAVDLDHARYELMEVRRVLGINDHYMDKVWELETAIATIIITAEDLNFQFSDMGIINELSENLRLAWFDIIQSPLAPEALQLTKADVRNLAHRKSVLNKVINGYLEVAGNEDATRFEVATKNIELAYLDFLYVFGDFKNEAVHASLGSKL